MTYDSITHQYIVSYYPQKAGKTRIYAITWQNILTEELDRHDGPCFYVSADSFEIFQKGSTATYSKDEIKLFKQEGHALLIDTCVKDDEISSKTFKLYIFNNKPVYQYIVTYRNDTIVRWSNILTEQRERHDGPATYVREKLDNQLADHVIFYGNTGRSRLIYVKPSTSEEYDKLIEPKIDFVHPMYLALSE